MRLRIAILLLGLFGPTSVLAKGDGKVEFDRGMRFYQAQEYDAALPYFQKAYALSGKRPSTIRALAQCERALKLYEEAVTHFKEYLASKPSDAKEVEETLDLLSELVVERNKSGKPPAKVEPKVAAPPPQIQTKVTPPPPVVPPPAPPPPAITRSAPPPEEPSIVESPWLWVGVGAVVVVGGGIALALALSGGVDDPYQGTSGVILSGP